MSLKLTIQYLNCLSIPLVSNLEIEQKRNFWEAEKYWFAGFMQQLTSKPCSGRSDANHHMTMFPKNHFRLNPIPNHKF